MARKVGRFEQLEEEEEEEQRPSPARTAPPWDDDADPSDGYAERALGRSNGASTEVKAPATIYAAREKRSGYRADVDGLRAVAVTAVIAFHLNKAWLPGGFTGVDIFFVISGFVVSGSLLREQAPNALDFFISFYARRARRRAPALFLTVVTSTLAISAIVHPDIPNLDGYYASGQLASPAGKQLRRAMVGYWTRG